MTYHVIFYCPDRHIQYDGRLPYEKGVGGGITARIRMARALYRAGHQVSMVVNCGSRTRVQGVDYFPLDRTDALEGDVLILNTSGGDLDLSPALQLKRDVGLTAVWTSGTPRPGGLDELGYQFVYAKSNFLRDVAEGEWEVPPENIFVAYNGFANEDFPRFGRIYRDPRRLVYFSHPSKGLDTAIDLLRRLRWIDPRYRLEVYGGNQLWGQEEEDPPNGDGVTYHGLVGQRTLAKELSQASYSINLQSREEPFGMVITESMRAGCVVLASPVGAYKELVRDGEDGFLIEGDHTSEEARERATRIILYLTQNPSSFKYVQDNALNVIWDTDTMVKVWETHWGWIFGGRDPGQFVGSPCEVCGGGRLGMEDGYHCTGCGRYTRGLSSP